MLRLEFIILFQHGVPDVTVQWVQIWRAWGPLSLNEPIRMQSVLHDAHTLRKAGCLGWNSIILSFSDIFQPNLVIKCTFDCLTFLSNFMQKSSRIAEISTKVVGRLLFMFTLYVLYLIEIGLPALYGFSVRPWFQCYAAVAQLSLIHIWRCRRRG